MARLPKAERKDIPEDLHYAWDRIGAGREVPNIFRVMANNPPLMLAYVRLGNALWRECGLDVATRELVILRTAFLRQSTYEWHQHVRLGRDAGLSDDQIIGLQDWQSSKLFSDSERALFAYADALNESDHPPQAIHDNLAKHYPASTVVGVNLLTAFYGMTAKFLSAMEMETEDPFIGWKLGGGR